MKLIVTLFCLSFSYNSTFAQQENNSKNKHSRCGTMEAIEANKQANPQQWALLQSKIDEAARTNNTARTSVLTSIVTIPVVVHVVHATPSLVTEEQVDYLLNRLNGDYSGLNADSTNAPTFYNVRGHSLIRFTRARRDPSGNLTNGLEKKISRVGIYGTTYQRIKHSSDGGLDPWDITRYYNIWVGADSSGLDLLGIAPGIGPGNATETQSSQTGIDGVCLEIRGFSNGCYSVAAFNLARTAVHEIGHNFGLYHTFSGCSNGADFAQISTGQLLPNSLLSAADDTPSQSTSTSGCPSGIQASNCSGVSSKMYQNYMDYSNDACLTLFTDGQVARMHYILENFRPGYLTTNGAIPPASVPALDVMAAEIVSPGGSEFNNSTCALTSYPMPSCAGNFVPKLLIKNMGSSTITSVTATITVNGTPIVQTFTGLNILTHGTATLTFSTAILVAGNNTITFSLSAPNGGVDAVLSNNSISQNINITSGVGSILEGFETTFPASNWSLVQAAGTGNWARTTSASKVGNASIKFDNFNFLAGASSNLTSPPIAISNAATTASLRFHYAYQAYSSTATEPDKLDVLISTNCGQSWAVLWTRTGANLITASPTSSQTSFTPSSGQWTSSPIDIDLISYKNQNIQIQFKATSGFGNNLYLDDIRVTTNAVTPLQLISFTGFQKPDKTIQLNWNTTNEVNCESFTIEKSANGSSFNNVEIIPAKNTASNQYSFIDKDVFTGANYYRLLQKDKDGKTTYSNIVLVNTKKSGNSFVVYPNPIKNDATINITSTTATTAEISLVDIFGRVVMLKKAVLMVGNQSINLETNQLPAGVYSVVLNFNNERLTQKLIKQ